MATEFRVRAQDALANNRVRANIRKALDGLVVKYGKAFPDKDELARLRDQGRAIRAHALSRLPGLLEELEKSCTANGIQVHWAETTDEANCIVLDIMRRHDARMLIKGKSMVSEEMGLNAFLAAQGIEAVETDLGELIVQLAGEPPFHIVAPAIHMDRKNVAELFKAAFPDIPYSEDAEELTATARRIMREKFRGATIGLSGVNFAVAETGTLCLVENEGNGRMCTTVPDVHIAVTGIEKIVSRLDQIPSLLTLLVRSATGQPITTYFNMISSPRRDGELDGPKEVHLVLLDNGRSRIFGDPELQATLRCIRCGACINHCPVYARLGGHAYGTVYPGPIGSILEPQLQGLEAAGELADASSLCGACAEVCPVRISIPLLLNRLRSEGARTVAGSLIRGQGSRRSGTQALIWRMWAWFNASPGNYRLLIGVLGRVRALAPTRFGAWTRTREAPRLAPKSLHRMAQEEGFDHE